MNIFQQLFPISLLQFPYVIHVTFFGSFFWQRIIFFFTSGKKFLFGTDQLFSV